MNLNRLRAIERRRQKSIDDLVSRFARDFDALLSIAKARTLARSLIAAPGSDKPEYTLLRRLDQVWREEAERAGAGSVIREAVNGFNAQFGFFEDVLKLLRVPMVRWADSDLVVFDQAKLATVDGINTAIELAGQLAKQRALFSVGATRLVDLSAMIAEKLDLAGPKAIQIADTSVSTFYRVVADRGYQQIEATQKEALRYRYYGPEDKLTRPFCEHLLAVDKTYTRAEIDRMNNHQLPNVFQTGGGWNCRHQWIIDVQ